MIDRPNDIDPLDQLMIDIIDRLLTEDQKKILNTIRVAKNGTFN